MLLERSCMLMGLGQAGGQGRGYAWVDDEQAGVVLTKPLEELKHDNTVAQPLSLCKLSCMILWGGPMEARKGALEDGCPLSTSSPAAPVIFFPSKP